jgi:hypothetical protein
MNRQFEQRLRRLEQKQSLALEPKKAWMPKWLTDLWSEDFGLPFDSEERGLASLRQIQKLKMVATPADNRAPPIARDPQVATSSDELQSELADWTP